MSYLERLGFEIGSLQGRIIFLEYMKTLKTEKTDPVEIERLNEELDICEDRLYNLLGVAERNNHVKTSDPS